ncbi:cupin domain-containing protein [Streptodolium elevatio]
MTPESIAARLGGDVFLAQALHREHRLLPGAFPNAHRMLTWDALNTILATHRLDPPRLRLSTGGEALPQYRYTVPVVTRRHVVWHRLEPAELHARLAEGATLVLDAADELHAPVGDFAAELERFLRTGIQVNVYASFTQNEGFGIHWDDHDVIAVQLAGAKRWRIYGPTRDAPTYRDTDTPEPPTGAPIAELVMRPGDALYLPRGWWHAVATEPGRRSLHITCGFQTHTGADLLTWVADQLRRHHQFRTDLPRLAGRDDQDAYLKAFRDTVAAELTDDVIDRYTAAKDTIDPGRMRPSLPHLVPGSVPATARVRFTAARARLDVTADTVSLAAAGTAWDFAPAVAALLQPLVDGQVLTITRLAELAGIPADQAAAVIAELVAGQAATLELLEEP